MPESSSQTAYRYFPVAKRDRDWGLFVTTVGGSHFGTGTEYPPAGHPKSHEFSVRNGRVLHEHQLIYISAGRGWFESSESERVTIEAGQVILLFPGVWHSYAPARETGWDEHWVGFNGDTTQRLVRGGFFSPDRPVLRAGEENRLLTLFTELNETAASPHPALQQIMAGISVRMLALVYSAQQARLAGEDPGANVIHQAITRMREAHNTNLKMATLARELNVSYRWFRRAFAHHTGLSPHHYFLDIRLARARDFLAQTSLSIKEVAAQAGFDDAQYFCKFFHRKVGVTPSEWRERAQKDRPESPGIAPPRGQDQSSRRR